jgi:hypothetical protein
MSAAVCWQKELAGSLRPGWTRSQRDPPTNAWVDVSRCVSVSFGKAPATSANGASFSFRSREASEENHLSRPSLVAKTPDQSDGFATDFCTVAELSFCDNISCFPLSF